MADMKVTTALTGVAKFVRAVELTDVRTRKRTLEVIRRGTVAVADKARSRAPKRSGELAYAIRAEINEKNLVGYAKAGYGKLQRRSRAMTSKGQERFQKIRERRKAMAQKAKQATSSRQALANTNLGIYAPVVEWGDPRRNKPAKHFMIPAFQEERPTIAAGLREAPLLAAQESALV